MRSLMRPLTGCTLVGLECGLAGYGGLWRAMAGYGGLWRAMAGYGRLTHRPSALRRKQFSMLLRHLDGLHTVRLSLARRPWNW